LKPKLLIYSLTSCSGCISTLMALDIFPQFLERTRDIIFPFINDEVEIEDCDIALIEGCVSENEQIELVKNIRYHAKKVYSLGSCASFGGILSLSKTKNANPISKYIEIDGIIPGCPPPSKMLGNILLHIIENKEIELSKRNLCANCPLKADIVLNTDIEISRFEPNPEEISDFETNGICFLKKGILCLGPITREGCEHKCIIQGMPCEGCMGPISKDYTSNVINFLSLVNLSPTLRKYDGIFYRFSRPILER